MTQPIDSSGGGTDEIEVPPASAIPLGERAPVDPRGAPTPLEAELPRDPGEAPHDAVALSRDLGISITVAHFLHRAGMAADDSTRRYIAPKLAHLSSPDAMVDRAAGAERIARAIRARERIAVFGDYDCDGITSAAIVTGFIRGMGGEAVPLLASRRLGGYGFSAEALGRVKASGATLLVTCDCGSSDHPRLDDARRAGLDVVVIDHHLVPAEPLPVLAFLNPHRAECGFGYKGLASCGLALSLGAAVRKALGVAFDLRPWLDLVAVGTVADVAPLTGDNRALVRAGLAVVASGARPGLAALAANAKLDRSRGLRAEDIAYRIAPRLNAPGRLVDPDDALELLLERDPARAIALAAGIEQLTLQRRAIQDRILREALSDIAAGGFAEAPAIVLARQGWHAGVVGIVAGRVASTFGKPTIVVALEGATGRGSVRGPAGARLYDALSACRAELVAFGGHQAAAGVEVRAERVEALRAAFCDACSGWEDAGPPRVEPDVRLDDRDDPSAVAYDLERLEPCGEQNPAPKLLVRGRVRTSRDLKGHLKLELVTPRAVVSAFGFEMGGLAESLAKGVVDVVGSLRHDTWRGGDAVEMRIERLALRR